MFAAVLNGFDVATAWFYQRIDDPSGSSDLSAGDRARVRSRQVEAIVRMTPALMTGNITCAMSLLVVLAVTGQSSPLVTSWAAVAIAGAVLTLWRWTLMRDHPFPPKVGENTVHRLVGNIAITAALWSPVGSVIVPTTTGSAQAFAVVMVAGLVAAGTIALYPIPAAAMLYAITLWLGGMVGFATFGDPTTLGYFLVGVGFLITVARAISRHSELFVAEFVGRLRLDQQKRMIEALLLNTRAEAAEERLDSKRRLAQSQTMKAIGQLTAGVAHDFNNLLAAIQGHAELLETQTPDYQDQIKAILRATHRGSDLVSQLLSVGRCQHLQPKAIDVAMLVARMTALLDRTLDPRIAIHSNIEPGLQNAVADPARLEAAILSLAFNARDAMPDGGTLTIACQNEEPRPAHLHAQGRPRIAHVCIAVSDTGIGMSAEVRERATQPFFTTKKFGSASGLGLSSVQGFAEQSNGSLSIESAPGHGTTVEILLPAAPREEPRAAPPNEIPQARGERILLVDDDTDVMNTIRANLETLGYTVIATRGVNEALGYLKDQDTPDLVLSDVMLANGTLGYDLGVQLGPNQRIAYISGYTGHDNDRLPAEVAGAGLLPKPFTRSELARFVRAVLDTK